jgi:ABC-type transporter Mla MlaB component
MLRIQRTENDGAVLFTLSGRIEAEELVELQKLLESDAHDHRVTLDLKEVKLVDRETVGFLAECEAKGITLAKCPAYIRQWIEKEGAEK